MEQQFTKDEIKHLSQKQARAVFYNPSTERVRFEGKILEPETFYIGHDNVNGSIVPTWDIPVFNLKTAKATKKKLKEAGVTLDSLKESDNPWAPEFREDAKALHAALKTAASQNKLRLAGIGTNAAWSTINVTNVSAQVLGMEFVDRVALDAVRTINTPDLLLEIDVGSVYEGYGQVGENVSVEPNRQNYTTTSFDLPKDIAFFGQTIEAGMKARHNIYQLHVNQAPLTLRKLENQAVVTVMESATDVAAGDWGAFTSGISDRNPVEDIRNVCDTIRGNGGNPNRIVLHNRPWTDFVSNTFPRGAYNGLDRPIGAPGQVVSVDIVPGVQWYIDNDKTATLATVFSDDAIIRANGPTMVAQFEDNYKDVQLYKTTHFNQTKLVQSGRARDLTSISA